jgi:tetratricopeptide (TPR) repeat protein
VPHSLVLIATLIVGVAATQTSRAPARGLTEAPRLAAVYDTILQGRFDAARDQLARTCPPAPLPACDTLREVALWWQIQQDPSSRVVDAQMERIAATAIDSTTRWTRREPQSAEAFFYLAGAHAPLAQWRVLRGDRLAAARDGKRIKDALERALELDPSLQDAWFGIGLYHYYADVAPAALKFLRMLLLLPGGDRAEGLQEMLRAREQGQLLRGEADYQMHWLYLWYEHQPGRALDLLRGLDARYRSNPLFLQRIAEVEHVYFSDHEASARTWQTLLDRARAGGTALPSIAEMRARIGLAGELNELSQPARALTIVDPVIRSTGSAPYGARALAQIARGDALAALGDRSQARAAYDDAIVSAPRDDPDDVRTRARHALARLGSR